MKGIYRLFLVFSFILCVTVKAQNVVGTVTDYDGNIYHAVQIGNQIWLQENMRNIHYSDGTSIPGVAAYNNNEANAAVFGRLYNWNAMMKNSTTPGAKGIAPDGYHIPTDAEWSELENYLGGVVVAGGKMKTTGTSLWNSPNTGATNSSGFSILPAGEYDAYYSPNKYQSLNEYAVYWTSTQINVNTARERYLAYNSAASSYYDWYKVMKYSVRCIKDNNATSVEDDKRIPNEISLAQNYPNPFNPSTVISYSLPQSGFVTLKVYDTLGREIAVLVNGIKGAGSHKANFTINNISSGVYVYTLKCGTYIVSKKMLVGK